MRDLLDELRLPANTLTPDKNALDDEFEQHPDAVARVADAVAEAKRVLDLSRLEHGAVERRVRVEVLDNASSVRKQTVKDIDAAVDTDPEVRKSARTLVALENRVQRLNGLLAAVTAKTSALKHLSELYQAGYFTTSSSTPRKRGRDD